MKRTLALIAAALALWTEGALACQVGPMKPLELLFAPFFKGPSFIRTNSHGAQFAGRTTISSGSASQVVSTSNVASDSLIFPVVQVALPAAYLTRGIIDAISADNTWTASTSAIYSGGRVNYGIRAETALTSIGVSARPLRINSVVNGVSFALSTVDSGALGFAAATIMWDLPSAKPEGIKVNTISDGGYFTLGWADGVARPVDVTVMWETKRPGSA